MGEFLKQIFSSPFDEYAEFRRFVQRILLLLNLGVFALILFEAFFVQRRGSAYTIISLGIVLLVTQFAYWSFKRGQLLPTKLVLPVAAYAILTYVLILGNGIHDSSLIGYSVVITLSMLLLGPGSAIYVAFLSLTSLWLVVWSDIRGVGAPPVFAQYTGLDDFIIGGVLVSMTIVVLHYVQKRLYQLLENLNTSLEEQKKTTAELETLKNSLEEMVQERTAALHQSLSQLETLRATEQRLARMYQSIAVLARRIAQSSTQSTDTGTNLLTEITILVSDTFGYYHVGIFLLDREKQHAVLSAANSPGGQEMLAAHHLLPVNTSNAVGTAIIREEPYVISNTEASNSHHFKNPHLPETQAEAVFPLFAGGEIIGALDVQSKTANAFDANAIEVLEILADQIAVAIYNAQLLEHTQLQLAELQAIYREQARQSWQRLGRHLRIFGYRYRPGLLQPLENPLRTLATPPDDIQIIQQQERNETRILAPVQLRGETLAVLEIRAPLEIAEEDESLPDTIQALTERIALALENARLYEETTRRAQREHMVAQIANALRSTNDPDEMLQTAIRELKQALGAREVRIVTNG